MEYKKPPKPWVSPEYRAWIRMKPCLLCGSTRLTDAHHVRKPGDGWSQKPSDDRCIPLGGTEIMGGCGCHGLVHTKGNSVFGYDPIDAAIKFKHEWDNLWP